MGGLIYKCLHLSIILSSLSTHWLTHPPIPHPPSDRSPPEKQCSMMVLIQDEFDEAKLQRLNVQYPLCLCITLLWICVTFLSLCFPSCKMGIVA